MKRLNMMAALGAIDLKHKPCTSAFNFHFGLAAIALCLLVTPCYSQGATESVSFEAATAQVNELLTTSAARREVVHCLKGKSTCRKLILLKDKQSGQPLKSFYMVFSSIERQTGATEYFLENTDGTFRSFLDDTFDGKTIIDFVHVNNSKLKVTFDSDGMPSVHDAYLVRHASSFFAIADLRFSNRDSVLEGTEFDSANADYKKDIKLTYKRRRLLEQNLDVASRGR